MTCEFSHVAYHDPIIDPGNDEFMHLHMFFGNVEVDHRSTWTSLRSSGDSTCRGGPLNRTAYWFPAVFDSQDHVVVPDRFELYYKGENAHASGAGQELQPYPYGLRMVAGARWTPEGLTYSVSHASEGGSMRLTVRFPYCWDGENLWLEDGSHMAYGTNNTWGACPSSHPVHLIELTEFADFFNVHEDTQDWYLSSDRMNPSNPAPNMSTLHADWFGAWDHDVLDWMTECLRREANSSGGVLCDVGNGPAQLAQEADYVGPTLLSGWTPTP